MISGIVVVMVGLHPPLQKKSICYIYTLMRKCKRSIVLVLFSCERWKKEMTTDKEVLQLIMSRDGDFFSDQDVSDEESYAWTENLDIPTEKHAQNSLFLCYCYKIWSDNRQDLIFQSVPPYAATWKKGEKKSRKGGWFLYVPTSVTP